MRVVVHWVITFAIAAVITYFTYAIQQMTHKSTPVESGIYTPLTRVGWAIFLCLVVYACIQGYGGPVNVFLSLSIWKPLARLTYAIYLVHMPIMLWTAASARRPVYFSSRLTVRCKLLKYCVLQNTNTYYSGSKMQITIITDAIKIDINTALVSLFRFAFMILFRWFFFTLFQFHSSDSLKSPESSNLLLLF